MSSVSVFHPMDPTVICQRMRKFVFELYFCLYWGKLDVLISVSASNNSQVLTPLAKATPFFPIKDILILLLRPCKEFSFHFFSLSLSVSWREQGPLILALMPSILLQGTSPPWRYDEKDTSQTPYMPPLLKLLLTINTTTTNFTTNKTDVTIATIITNSTTTTTIVNCS